MRNGFVFRFLLFIRKSGKKSRRGKNGLLTVPNCLMHNLWVLFFFKLLPVKEGWRFIWSGTLCLCFMMLTFGNARALPIHLTVTPKGTNQVALTFGPVATYPESIYEVLVRTNSREGRWVSIYDHLGPTNQTVCATVELNGVPGLTVNNLKNWTFVAGYGGDSDGNGLSDIYEDLVSRTDPYNGADPYASPMGDGWTYLQKMQQGMDPYLPYPPPPPQILSLSFFENTNSPSRQKGTAVLKWAQQGHVEYFIVERANRRPRPPVRRQPPGQPGAYSPDNRQREDPFITDPYEVAAKIPEQPGAREYRYTETNVNTFFQARYRVRIQYPPSPLHTFLDEINAAIIRKTAIPAIVQASTNGYNLVVKHPIENAFYLLLVRDKINPQWRASGYFASGTNREPVSLHVDSKGMMNSEQRPLAMPSVKWVPAVSQPEFVAGWGEDSDGDGLPDIYEVLVTKTEPDKTDTGNKGIIDGYKDFSGDGWSALEKFRRRLDPFHPFVSPPVVELNKPTMWEIMRSGVGPQTDLHYEPRMEIRPAGYSTFFFRSTSIRRNSTRIF